MSVLDLMVGAPVWQRSWCLPIWFDSLEANVDPGTTGLIFVVPASDTQSREVIAERARGYAFVEVLRDKHEQFDRGARLQDNHLSLASARNLLLRHACHAGPRWFLSWDSDFLVSPGVVDHLVQQDNPLTTVWAWLNRKPPQCSQHWVQERQEFIPVEWNEPVNQTAMQWDPDHRGVAQHLDPHKWYEHAQGLWPCDVALAWQLMKDPVWRRARYGAHPHGEDIPFNWALHESGIQRWCYGQQPGLHLFHRQTAEREIQDGYPAIMERAKTDVPLAATRPDPESESLRAIGFYPRV